MNILLLEPFCTGSHQRWAEDFCRFSKHQVHLLSLPGYHWKWRMHGAAVTLAHKANELVKNQTFDLILATDMLDLGLFLSLTRHWSHSVATAVYFHENQLNYPWSPSDQDVKLQRDNHYAFINYTSALVADKVFFNSSYHQRAFLNELPKFLKSFPDYQNPESHQIISSKSSVLSLGMNLKELDEYIPATIQKPQRACVLWNHRWEYDKGAEEFFSALFEIQDRGIDFKLVVLGEELNKRPAVFNEARERLKEKILHFGFAETREEYARWLWTADVLPVTAIQDFFGGSVVEAMYCNVVPFLPKRLAYMEHIPEQFHSTFFYEEGELVNKLQRRIMDVKYLRVMNTNQYVSRYDWSIMAAEYDLRLQEMVSQKG